MDETTLQRREAILAMLAGLTVTITGCGGGGGNSGNSAGTNNPTAVGGDRHGSITANHGHTAVITLAQLQAGNAVTLDIRGSADHNHRVELTAAEVRTLAGGGEVTKVTTSTDGHNHQINFRPGTPVEGPGY